jgi:DNA-binding beta-propeller fold protein YncE
MKYNFLKKFAVLAAMAAVFTIQSCSDDPEPVRRSEDGFYIVNEGAFTHSNASISFYDRSTNTVINDVFALKNGRALGDQAQSMTVINGKAYIAVQGSNKIEVINADDYSLIATITEGIFSPRYILQISETKAYVSDWGADANTGTIKILDLTTNKITGSIDNVGIGTNRMLKVGSGVYVTNAGSYAGDDNTVIVINSATDAISGTLTVGDNPNSLQIDNAINMWVASTGDVNYQSESPWGIDEANSTPGSITKLTKDLTVAFTVSAPQITDGGINNLVISTDGTQLYYIFNSAIYTMSTSATALPTSPFKAANSYYGLAIDPYDGNLIACKAPTFTAAGSIEIIDNTGTVKSTFTTGIAPNGCAFK